MCRTDAFAVTQDHAGLALTAENTVFVGHTDSVITVVIAVVSAIVFEEAVISTASFGLTWVNATDFAGQGIVGASACVDAVLEGT